MKKGLRWGYGAFGFGLIEGRKILAWLAALGAKVRCLIRRATGVALSESGGPGLRDAILSAS
jgi:hypothetical protein